MPKKESDPNKRFAMNPILDELLGRPIDKSLQARPLINPAPIKKTSSAVEDAKAEKSEIKKAIEGRAKAEVARLDEVMDTAYYAVVVFEHWHQRDDFLAHFDMMASPDGFVNGLMLAKRMGVTLQGDGLEDRSKPPDKTWAKMVRGGEKDGSTN